MTLPDLALIAVGQNTPGGVGDDDVDDVGCLGRFAEELLDAEASSPHSHHAGPGACFNGSDQGRTFFRQQSNHILPFFADVLKGPEHEDGNKNGHGSKNDPRRDSDDVLLQSFIHV